MSTRLTRRWRDLPDTVADGIAATALALLGMVSVALRPPFVIQGGGFGGGPGPEHHVPSGTSTSPPFEQHGTSAFSYGLVALAFLPLAFRRTYPLAVLAVVTAVAAVNDLVPGPPSLVFLAPLIALYTVGTMRSRRTLVVAAGLTIAVQLAVALPNHPVTTFWAADALRIISMVAVAAALGDATRNRRAYIAEVEQRAAEAERTREEEARRRVDEERLRIARELHDVTAHSLSIIAVQSGAAAHVIDSDPAEARRSLESIRRTSKEALDELRAMLGVLRSADEGDAPLAPVPGLVRLDELAGPMREAGFNVTLDLDDEVGEIPAVVDASAYRIVQEALTNVVRHAGPCSVRVSIHRSGRDLAIEVVDTGRGPGVSSLREGHGLTGMRERAVALGGSFSAGSGEAGGFRVAALVPLGTSTGRSA